MNYKLYTYTIFLIFIFATTIACEKLIIRPIEGNKEVFDYIWNYTKTYYCCADIKEIDWDAMYQNYAPQVSDDMDETLFFNLVHTMLLELEDGMVSLTGPQGTVHYEGYCAPCPANFDPDLIKASYKPDQTATYTMIGDIAYINNFENESFAEDIDFLRSEENKFIFDFRNVVKDPFRDHSFSCDLYPSFYWVNEGICVNNSSFDIDNLTRRIKTGPTENDYRNEDIDFCTIYPPGEGIVLSNRHTVGGGNIATHLLLRDDIYTLVGDTTGGGNIDVCTISLSNGWLLSIPRGTLLLEDGTGIDEGIVPNVFIDDDPMTTDTDEIIEMALELLN